MPTAEQQLSTIRKVLPRQFQSRFDKLWKKQRAELIKIVGSPPDVSKVSKTQWKKWQEERAAALLALMLGYTLLQTRQAFEELQSLDIPQLQPRQARRRRQNATDDDSPSPINQRRQSHHITIEDIQRRVIARTRERATFASEVINRTTRTRLENGGNPEEVMSDVRSTMIAVTEMTAARSAVLVGMYEELAQAGVECELVWRLRPCQHCDVCPLLADTGFDFWSRFVPKGPPVHPHCCCQLELIFGNRATLLRSRRIKTGPPVKNVRMAIQRSGFKIR